MAKKAKEEEVSAEENYEIQEREAGEMPAVLAEFTKNAAKIQRWLPYSREELKVIAVALTLSEERLSENGYDVSIATELFSQIETVLQ